MHFRPAYLRHVSLLLFFFARRFRIVRLFSLAGTEVREEYKRGFGVPTLIAVHPENDPRGDGLELAKAYAAATGGDRAGVLESSFVAEVKSDLMGEQVPSSPFSWSTLP